eukprot:2424459-Rhodomonas_salina.2
MRAAHQPEARRASSERGVRSRAKPGSAAGYPGTENFSEYPGTSRGMSIMVSGCLLTKVWQENPVLLGQRCQGCLFWVLRLLLIPTSTDGRCPSVCYGWSSAQ